MSNSQFSENQFDVIYPDGIEYHYWNKSRNHIIYSLLRKYSKPSDFILEIGCGRGIVVNFLRQKGLNCFGAELGNASVLNSVKDVVFANTDAMTLPAEFRNNITVLCLFDVIEHIEKPQDFLKSINNSYPNIHTILISVPAGPRIWSRFDEFNGHFRRYTLQNLQQDSSINGFKTKQLSYLYNLLYLAAIFLKTMKKQRTETVTAPSKTMRPIHALLSIYFRLEFLLMPKKLKGSSAICIITKNHD